MPAAVTATATSASRTPRLRLNQTDVVRHPLVGRIVEAYEARAEAEGETSRRREKSR